uniref:ribosomal protein S3 n=1 Tax=Hypnea spinella TaxID=105608 RepID=UPI003001617E|nr:ribosomal protein S3 [Hypnea spinella]
MAQKINPTSARLGISQLWAYNTQFYGKSFKSYFLLFHYYMQSFWFLKKISNATGFIINHQKWKITQYADIVVNIYYTESFFALKKDIIEFYNLVQSTLNILFKNKVKTCFYLMPHFSLSHNLLYSYSQFLASEGLVAKKILWTFSKLLHEYLNSLRLVYTPQGLKICKLKGFKIQIVGHIDDSKTQMAKSLNLSVGNSCLTSLQDSILYSPSVLYSKSGTCGLKIWLFYEFIQ